MPSTLPGAHATAFGRAFGRAFAAALGPVPTAAGAERAAAELLVRWSEPHRHYHTPEHLGATLDAVRALLTWPDPGARPAVPDPGAVELAVWFHDAVYAGRPGDDEEASAVLAERLLPALGQPASRVAEVARLVRLTAGHTPADGDVAGQVLCDADLSILGAPAQRYRAYTEAVRREYAHVPGAAFRAGRAAVLRGLLAAGPPYRTAPGRLLWQDQALANVSAELAELAGPAGPAELAGPAPDQRPPAPPAG